ncbi:class I SAM-dependent methyltransferase [Streptomyces sp. A7024]|uniref:Class I SAM-dependent methyltransferase n=1 Tax=Streptomyces coryli TaxID=1128680 RepID=A0A6G4UE05_9ACTN|nr:class I SAM-dependent methyltransferase [Streptomyces coryli]NGN69950.1 class I SAM-dependent methyltransferase [Streptomyces coryli]
MRLASNAGYEEEADDLAARYQKRTFAEAHADTDLHLFPVTPARILEVGAGTGRDAAGLAELGHTVTAVEPTDGLRAHARRLHPGLGITWLEDALPELAAVTGPFDCIHLNAVWMHLDAAERHRGMHRLAELLAPGGTILMTLRHGPVPSGRRMYEVSGAETIELGAAQGLELVEQADFPDWRRRPGVSWTRVALRRA